MEIISDKCDTCGEKFAVGKEVEEGDRIIEFPLECRCCGATYTVKVKL